MKSDTDVIHDFHATVNMSPKSLKAWLATEESTSTGWHGENGDDEAESPGHHSGTRIVEILEKNPSRDPKKYDEEDLKHMRKVAGYNNRHLAQESSANADKSDEELTKTKSYASLKNWGHDALIARKSKSNKGAAPDGEEQNKEKHKQEAQESKEDEADKGKRQQEEIGQEKEGSVDQPEKDNQAEDKEQETTQEIKRKKEDEKDGTPDSATNGADEEQDRHRMEELGDKGPSKGNEEPKKKKVKRSPSSKTSKAAEIAGDGDSVSRRTRSHAAS